MLRAPKLFWLTVLLAACSLPGVAQTGNAPAQPAQPTLTPAPSPSLAKDSRFYELRTYYAAPGKLEDLHARFRNHTIKLFKKHGIHVVGFWGPTDKEKGSENTLIYLLSYTSREARADAWKAFGADPDWQAARKKSEENGRLVEKVDYVFLLSTDYAPVK